MRGIVAVHVEPRVDERADEPRPDGALMIGAVACGDAAFAPWLVGGVVRRERARAERRNQISLHDGDDRRALRRRRRSRAASPPAAKSWFGRTLASTVPAT